MSLDSLIRALVVRVATQFNTQKAMINGKEPSIAAGTAAQYWRGDKTWRTLATDAEPPLPGGGTVSQYLRGDKTWQDYIQSTNAGFVNSISTANHVLSGLQTVGGVAIGAGGRVLLNAQTDGKENGVWIVGSGAWARATDANTSARLAGYVATVSQGTQIGSAWRTTFKSTDVIGVNNVRFYKSGVEMVSPFTFPVPVGHGHHVLDLVNEMPYYYDAVGLNWVSANGVMQRTNAQRLAMATVAKDVIVRETDTGLSYMWDGAAWQSMFGTETTLHRCRVLNVAGQAFTTGGASQVVTFDTEVEDTSGMWNSGAPTVITVPEAGKYLVIARVSLAVTAGTLHAQVAAGGNIRQIVRGPAANVSPTFYVGEEVFTLAAGDQVSMALFQNSGATASSHASTQYGLSLEVIKLPDSQVVTARAVGALCSLGATAIQTILNGANPVITLDSVLADTDGMADIANNRIVIQTDGYYDLRASITWAGAASPSGYRQARITLNGNEWMVGRQRSLDANVGHYGIPVIGPPVLLHAGDVIQMTGQHTQGTAGSTNLNTAVNAGGTFVNLSAIMRSDTPF